MAKNKREIGTELEDKVAKLIAGCKKTSNSGATWKNGDLIIKGALIVECKKKNDTLSFRCSKKELDSLKKKALQKGLDWLFVMEDGTGETYALCSITLFSHLVNAYVIAQKSARSV